MLQFLCFNKDSGKALFKTIMAICTKQKNECVCGNALDVRTPYALKSKQESLEVVQIALF